VVTGNTVVGEPAQGQTGIRLWYSYYNRIDSNTLSNLALGISDENALDTLIVGNLINPAAPPGGFITPVAIRSTRNFTITNILSNRIRFTQMGIQVIDPVDDAVIAQNMMEVTGVGIHMESTFRAGLSGNTINAQQVGVSILNSPEADVRGNVINMNNGGVGIGVSTSDRAWVAENEVTAPNVGIRITATESISVTGNLVTGPNNVGIAVDGDFGAWVDSNEINGTPVGIHYRGGKEATVSTNTVNSLAGGVGIRLGTGAVGCPINVDNILVQDNVLAGGVLGVEVLCDVGTHTLINN
jgi:nitrous oxidase accessory protein NosD